MFSCFKTRLRSAYFLGILILVAAQLAASAQPTTTAGPRKITVYNAASQEPALDRAAARAYAGKYQVVDIKPGGDFSPARLKGHNPNIKDPRSMRALNTPIKAVIAYIVTPEGTVTEPRVIESSHKGVAEYVIKHMSNRRYAPARYRGAAVFSLCSYELSFPAGGEKDSSLFKDGHGIMGYRDR